MTVRIAIPVVTGSRKFNLDKGRPWSVFDQLMLFAVSRKSRAAGELAVEADAPRRLVLETLIRLMRAGWVNLKQDDAGVTFAITRAGKLALQADELPTFPKPFSRWMGFVIDMVTGQVYRTRDFNIVRPHVLIEQAKYERIVKMRPRNFVPQEDPHAFVGALLNEDEEFVSIDSNGAKLVERFALVTVNGTAISGLPARAPDELRALVLDAAATSPTPVAGAQPPIYQTPPAKQSVGDPLELIDGAFDAGDVIIGGEEHRAEFAGMIGAARRRLIIHSTFIDGAKFEMWRNALQEAAQRGVRIDILWGQRDTAWAQTKGVVLTLKRKLAESGIDNIAVHTFSTGSHAKFIIGDCGKSGEMVALIGSCNWFASSYTSIEVSARLRDPRMVSRLLFVVSNLTRGGATGHWTPLTNEMTMLADRLSRLSPAGGSKARMSVILGAQHARLVTKARDDAKKRLFVASHRLGPAMGPAVIVPAVAAAQARGIDAKIYYNSTSGGVTQSDASEISKWAATQGVSIQPISVPRLHAKVLAWDDDNLVVTSQNWLSADPGDFSQYREIGISIEGSGVARSAIERFMASVEQ